MFSIDKFLYRFGVILCLLVAILASTFLFSNSVGGWFMTSAVIWLLLMIIAVFFVQKSFFISIGALFATLVVGRLFGTFHTESGQNQISDPLLLGETGAGVPVVMWACTLLAAVLAVWIANYVRTHRKSTTWAEVTDESWGLFFIRVYTGMMFIPHFSGHILAGPTQFAIFESYFGSIGLQPAALMVILGGLAELIAGIGLSLGLYTRFAALIGSGFLFFSMLFGGHFSVGYVWILPTGGWEFGIFWAVMIACFIVLGGGKISVDYALKNRAS